MLLGNREHELLPGDLEPLQVRVALGRAPDSAIVPSAVVPMATSNVSGATGRASFGLYNTRAEVDGLAQALINAQGFFA